METTSIKNIRTIRDEIRDKIKTAPIRENKDNTYGSENEYTYKGLIIGIENLLIDITTLAKSPNKFLALSTYSERSTIHNYLDVINTYFQTPNNYISQFEALKILLRSFNIRNTTERQIEFEQEIGNISRLKIEAQENLELIKTTKENIESDNETINENITSSKEKLEKIENELEIILKRRDELISESEKIKIYTNELSVVRATANKNLQAITLSTNESKSNEKLIASFANKVQDREKKLTELEFATEENSKKLAEYESERENIINEAKNLIDSAKQALNYKTAEGISASFQVQYNKANDKWIFGSWITGAILCLITSISIGIWIVTEITDDTFIFIARVSLLPFPIIGAIFCANQYIRQKNIIEDYAYKMVLAKSIVGFSEQLKKNCSEDNAEYIHYIKTALEEIHKDPLRKRVFSESSKSGNVNLTQIGDLVEKLSKAVKP
ncbi:hypothetical protein [Flavobacterium sp.]|uniref:hypothetical protein n=1 Tax=Flavobacterium sp. TaxID=239 RepID=UPI0031D8CBEB